MRPQKSSTSFTAAFCRWSCASFSRPDRPKLDVLTAVLNSASVLTPLIPKPLVSVFPISRVNIHRLPDVVAPPTLPLDNCDAFAQSTRGANHVALCTVQLSGNSSALSGELLSCRTSSRGNTRGCCRSCRSARDEDGTARPLGRARLLDSQLRAGHGRWR